MPQEVRADLLLGRDTLSPGLIKAGRAAADASGNISQLTRDLYEVSKQRATPVVDLQDKAATAKLDDVTARLAALSAKTAKARLGVEDKDALAHLAGMQVKLDTLGAKVSSPRITVDGVARAEAQLLALDAQLDALDRKTSRLNILSRLGGASFLQPSALGAAAALLPTLIPLAAEVAAGVGAIGVSFAAAGVAALGFGALAKTVLTQASQDAAKLHELNQRLALATTKSAKDVIRAQIQAVEAGWTPAFSRVVGDLAILQKQWKATSDAIAAPALVPWLEAVISGLKLIRPALKPVADLFQGLGESLNAALANNAPRIRELAAAFGRFSATQLADVARFIKGIAEGIFSLGKDFAANGASFGAAGTWLAGIGDGFATWSKSDAARRDVRGFMKFLHDEGPVVKGILTDLGTILPGIFAGATTIGTLELQALGDFLNFVAGLPPGWQKPLTEFAGAMLLLSKVGVVKVGLVFTGQLASLLAGGGLAGATGPATAAGAAIAAGLVLRLREDLKKGIQGIARDLPQWVSGIGGVVSLSAQGWADAIVHHFEKPVRASMAAFGRALLASVRADWGAITDSFHAFAHTMAASFDALRHDIASIWDTVWRNTVGRARSGIDDAVRWVRTMEPRILGALWGLGHSLYAKAHEAFTEFLAGAKAVGGSILGWLGHFVSSIVGAITKLLHMSPPHPGSVFYDLGASMMQHLTAGIKAHAHSAANAARSAARGAVSSGAIGGDALANERLARRIFPWPASQWPAFVSLVMAESGFNRFARNPSSGAYGIPQALPPTKLPFAGQAAGGSHAGPQLSWMFDYIRGRYGTPAGAWAHETAFHWYGSGGLIPEPVLGVGLRSGRGYGFGENGPEMVTPARGGGGKIVLQIQPTGTSEFDRFMANWLSDAARVRGGGSLEVAFGNHH